MGTNERPLIATYIVGSQPRGTLYAGVTSNLYQRAYEHREGLLKGFTQRYGCKQLFWWEAHETMDGAIRREKAIKHYVRQWKVNLIEERNPHWLDLYPGLVGEGPVDLRAFNKIVDEAARADAGQNSGAARDGSSGQARG